MWILAGTFGVVIAFSWTAWLLLQLPLWMPWTVTALCVGIFIGVIVFRRVRAVRRAAGLQRELERQATQQADRVRADRRPELVALRQQMKDAIETIKRSKLGARGGKAALYALPWYAIIGPPAAGKTTAIGESGLSFAGSKSKLRGTAGTRNCDWWFSRDAILLDTAGRFAIEADDREEWHTFLDTIRRFRPARPLDGVIVALSVSDLLGASASDVEQLAKKLRERVDELITRLEMVLPVYVLFTKADLVAGFVEFWGDFSKQQRGQAWGAAFTLNGEQLDELAKACEAEFDVLTEALHARMLERLANEHQTESRSRVLQFLVEFQRLRTPVAQFIEELCRPDPYHDTPLLRGFYFSSGTQVGNPLEHVLSSMLRSFDLSLSPAAIRERNDPKSYFVSDVFQKVIFPDRHLAVRSTSRMRRHQRRQVIAVGAAVLLTLLVLVPAMTSYANNQELIDSTLQDVSKADDLALGNARAQLDGVQLLASRVSVLEERAASFHFSPLWGFYSAERLFAATKAQYVQRLRSLIEEPVKSGLAGEVRGIENLVAIDAKNFRQAYDRLKLYLVLGHPDHLRGEPESDDPAEAHCEQPKLAWAAENLSQAWLRSAKIEGASPQQLKSHACYYIHGLIADPAWAWTLDADAVASAQRRLASVSDLELRYAWLVEKYRRLRPIRPENVFIAQSSQYFIARPGLEVPGMYTAGGWSQVQEEFTSSAATLEYEPWVLGRDAVGAGTSSEQVDPLKELYFTRYTRAWSDFLAGLQVRQPEDLPSAIAELRVLSELNGPYTQLFNALNTHTRLKEKTAIVSDTAEKVTHIADKLLGDKKGPERRILPVEKHFEPLLRFAFPDPDSEAPQATPTGLSQYLTQLTILEVDLTQLAAINNAPSGEFSTKLERTAAVVRKLLGGLDTTNRILLEPLLMNPILGSISASNDSAMQGLSESWRSEVWQYWNTNLSGRYPFSNAPVDASIAEFAEFFRPGSGILWGFFDRNLAAMLEGSSSGFKARGASSAAFRGDFLTCLSHARAITDAVFGGAMEPGVQFSVNIHPAGSNVAAIELTVDGKSVIYRNEPERWQPLHWPGEEGPTGAKVAAKGVGANQGVSEFNGAFGLFRLLSAGSLRANPQGRNVYVASWKPQQDGPTITLDLKPSKASHPFSNHFFSRLKCPAALAVPGARQ